MTFTISPGLQNTQFRALAQVTRAHEDSVPEAEGRLDELIQALHTALARTAATMKEI
jgi:hypothetical protein